MRLSIFILSTVIASSLSAINFSATYSALEKFRQAWQANKNGDTIKSKRLLKEAQQELSKSIKSGAIVKSSKEFPFEKSGSSCFRSIAHETNPNVKQVFFCLDDNQSDSNVEAFQAIPVGGRFQGQIKIIKLLRADGQRQPFYLLTPDGEVYPGDYAYNLGFHSVQIYVNLTQVTAEPSNQ